jgi:hypothetical protein
MIQPQLPEKMIGQGRFLGQKIFKGGAVVILSRFPGASPGTVIESPIRLGQAGFIFPLRFGLSRGTGHGFVIGIQGLDLGRGFGDFVENRIFFLLLPNQVHQFHPRKLQKFDGLLQLRGHDGLLNQFKILTNL